MNNLVLIVWIIGMIVLMIFPFALAYFMEDSDKINKKGFYNKKGYVEPDSYHKPDENKYSTFAEEGDI